MPDYLEYDPCTECSHPEHEDGDCEQITGYDHINGDHVCGCPGPIDQIREAARRAALEECAYDIRATAENCDPDGDYRAGLEEALAIVEAALNPAPQPERPPKTPTKSPSAVAVTRP